ncbi:MAG TPA: AgmX/PglI C-terminal domain-containing protein, partial [Kofleriaceae bacterium]
NMRGTISVGGVEHDVAALVRGSETPGFYATALAGADWGLVELDGAGRYKLFFQLGPIDAEPLAPRLPSLAGLVRWLLGTDFESRASLAFSALLHAALLFGTFALYEHETPFVWPGARQLTADYIATRLEHRFAPPTAPAHGTGAAGPTTPAVFPRPFVDPALLPPRPVPHPKPGPTSIKPSPGTKAPPGTEPFQVLNGLIGSTHDTHRIGAVGDGTPRDETPASGGGLGPQTRGGGGPPGQLTYHGGPAGPLNTGSLRPGTTCLGHCTGAPPIEFKPPSECDRASPPSWCNGPTLSKEDVDRVVKASAGAIDACYQRALDRESGLAGTVTVRFSIDASGRVVNANVASSTLGDTAVHGCIRGVIRGLTFPAKGGASVNYPFVFSRGG